MKPNAPASATAATSAGVSPPPASGAWMIGCARPSRRVRTVCDAMRHLAREPTDARLTRPSWQANNREDFVLDSRIMDFAALQVFKAVADEGGISSAARKLHRVQSNVTTRIQQLEASLGTTLFVREKRRLHLSSAGRVFLHYAEQMLRLSEQARSAVLGDVPRGVLCGGTLGC